ncbi:MAG: hypothetical protein ACU84Q_00005 [Gammaproteobacteria bacterium]
MIPMLGAIEYVSGFVQQSPINDECPPRISTHVAGIISGRVALTENDDRIIWLTEAFAKMLELSGQDIVGKTTF